MISRGEVFYFCTVTFDGKVLSTCKNTGKKYERMKVVGGQSPWPDALQT